MYQAAEWEVTLVTGAQEVGTSQSQPLLGRSAKFTLTNNLGDKLGSGYNYRAKPQIR